MIGVQVRCADTGRCGSVMELSWGYVRVLWWPKYDGGLEWLRHETVRPIRWDESSIRWDES